MTDTTWEESQKRNPHSRFLIWLVVILLGTALAGIIIYNNRDFIPGLKPSGSRPSSREVFSTDAVSAGLPGSLNKSSVTSGSVRSNDIPSHAIRNAPVTGLDFVEINDIICRVMDRNDVRIKLSVRLGFGDTEKRSEVLVRREVIAVIVQKALQTMALEDVKIDKIKPVLLKNSNAIFEKKVFNDIVIDTISIEKVLNE